MIDYKTILTNCLLKRAKGFYCTETTTEYIFQDGKRVKQKQKCTKKYVLPDVNSAKILMEFNALDDVSTLTDEQLQVEKLRLLKLLSDYENLSKTTADSSLSSDDSPNDS